MRTAEGLAFWNPAGQTRADYLLPALRSADWRGFLLAQKCQPIGVEWVWPRRSGPGHNAPPSERCHTMSNDTEMWMVWVPARRKWIILANEPEARDFADKFGGTKLRPTSA